MTGAKGFTCYDFMGPNTSVCNETFYSNPAFCHIRADGVTTWWELYRTVELGAECQC